VSRDRGTQSEMLLLGTQTAQGFGVEWTSIVGIRWDEKAGLRRDAVRSQVIDVLEAQEIKETGNEEG